MRDIKGKYCFKEIKTQGFLSGCALPRFVVYKEISDSKIIIARKKHRWTSPTIY